MRRKRLIAGLSVLLIFFGGISWLAVKSWNNFTSEFMGKFNSIKEENTELRNEVAGLQLDINRMSNRFWKLPSVVYFAGSRVPLEKWDVKERLEREFCPTLGDTGQNTLYLKRMARYFPAAKKKFNLYKIPEQLVYMAIAESALLPRAASSKGAVGIWQFIGKTGQRFKLKSNNQLDERANFEKATDAAVDYLKVLNREMKGDWFLTLAAYNCGEGAVHKRMKEQEVNNFFQLALPQETERYVFKIIALSIILGHPKEYGFQIPSEELYKPIPTERIPIVINFPTKIANLAKQYDSHYREIKQLNPELKTNILPKGKYWITVPKKPIEEIQMAKNQ
jgi:hypothetical protein